MPVTPPSEPPESVPPSEPPALLPVCDDKHPPDANASRPRTTPPRPRVAVCFVQSIVVYLSILNARCNVFAPIQPNSGRRAGRQAPQAKTECGGNGRFSIWTWFRRTGGDFKPYDYGSNSTRCLRGCSFAKALTPRAAPCRPSRALSSSMSTCSSGRIRKPLRARISRGMTAVYEPKGGTERGDTVCGRRTAQGCAVGTDNKALSNPKIMSRFFCSKPPGFAKPTLWLRSPATTR